jgi:ribonuclease VapC
MTSFVDASVLVAILAAEADDEYWLQRLRNSSALITSPIAIWETVRAVSRAAQSSVDEMLAQLTVLLEALDCRIVQIGHAESNVALGTHARYGKGNHPAKLNMGDCFAYACAKTHSAKLLYKGDDFALTDLA